MVTAIINSTWLENGSAGVSGKDKWAIMVGGNDQGMRLYWLQCLE